MPMVVPDGRGRRHAAGQRRRHHGRDHRRLLRPDRGRRRSRSGDVLVIFGATLIVLGGHATSGSTVARAVDQLPQHRRRTGVSSVARATPAPSSSTGPGQLLRGSPRPDREREQLEPRLGDPRSGAGLAALPARGADARSTTTRCAPASTGSTSASVPDGVGAGRLRGERLRGAAASSSAPASKPGADRGQRRWDSRVTAWMAAVADATNLPVERRRPRGRCARRGILRPLGCGTRGVTGRLGPLVRRRADDRTGPDLGAARRAVQKFSNLGTGAGARLQAPWVPDPRQPPRPTSWPGIRGGMRRRPSGCRCRPARACVRAADTQEDRPPHPVGGSRTTSIRAGRRGCRPAPFPARSRCAADLALVWQGAEQ